MHHLQSCPVRARALERSAITLSIVGLEDLLRTPTSSSPLTRTVNATLPTSFLPSCSTLDTYSLTLCRYISVSPSHLYTSLYTYSSRFCLNCHQGPLYPCVYPIFLALSFSLSATLPTSLSPHTHFARATLRPVSCRAYRGPITSGNYRLFMNLGTQAVNLSGLFPFLFSHYYGVCTCVSVGVALGVGTDPPPPPLSTL